MAVIGVKELKSQASSILRFLREKKVKGYVITSRGKPVAKLTPIDEEELEDLILSMDNPKLKAFIEKARKEPSLNWEELRHGVKGEKIRTRTKKAS